MKYLQIIKKHRSIYLDFNFGLIVQVAEKCTVFEILFQVFTFERNKIFAELIGHELHMYVIFLILLKSMAYILLKLLNLYAMNYNIITNLC